MDVTGTRSLAANPEDGRGSTAALGWRLWGPPFLVYVSIGAVFQVFPPFFDSLQAQYGMDRFTAGLTMTAFLAPVVATALPLGRAVDRHGPAVVGRGGFVVLVLGAAATALAPGFVAVLVARAASGLGAGAVLVAALKLLASRVSPIKIGTALGIFVAGLPVGTGLAFDVLAPLTQAVGWRASAAGAAAVAAVGAVVFWYAVPVDVPQERAAPGPMRALVRNADVLRLMALVAAGYAAIIGFTTWAPSRVAAYAHLPGQTVTIVASTLLVIDIPFAPLWGRVSDRLGRRKPFIVAAFAVYAAGALAVPAVAQAGVGPLLLVVTGMGIGCAMFFPTSLAVVAELVGEEMLGAGYGLLLAAQVLGMAVGPLVLGLVFTHASTPIGFWLIGGVAAASLATALTLRTR